MTNTRMNGGGMPSDFGGQPNAFSPRIIDGAYKSNNGNTFVTPTPTVFDPTDTGIGYTNKNANDFKTTQARPFDKV